MNVTRKTREALSLLAFAAPAFGFYAVFMLWPSLGGLGFSLTDWNGLAPRFSFVGADNYLEALTQDPDFLHAVGFTAVYVVCMVVLQNVLSFGLAVLVESRRRSRGFFRTVFFLPNMVSMIIAGFMWMFLFTKVLPALGNATGLTFLDRSWIGDPASAFVALLVISLWGGVGYLMVIYIAALQGVPDTLKEAAAIDGATTGQVFWNVTFPLTRPALTIGIFLTLNSSFKVFDVVFALTGGGPGRATQVMALNIFEEAFRMNNRYGYASAKAMILFAIVAVITVVQLRFMKRREVEA